MILVFMVVIIITIIIKIVHSLAFAGETDNVLD
jgi:hypothetical protein